MIALIFSLALAAQTQPAAPPSDEAAGAPADTPPEQLYQPPRVRPFEVELDPGGQPPFLPGRPPATPVRLERYDGAYEGPATAFEQAFQNGVATAFAAGQALMGPLDGLWSVRGENGEALFEVVLTDPGGDLPMSGGWRDLAAPEGSPLAVQALGAVVRRDGGAVLALGTRRLSFTPDGQGGWRGLLDGERTVTLSRQ
ncbi:hypothetical protein Q0812_06745 [Brevundimonas sp. 2R-24]|uniref:Uncharacterized protein n=1 Tax=Peiella sedimenti TaxID=3061083 RepID=A0ABT8SKP3_9CAUL|nr:hypothetical protein [Caulobacteraceae bacterium XZ-24]